MTCHFGRSAAFGQFMGKCSNGERYTSIKGGKDDVSDHRCDYSLNYLSSVFYGHHHAENASWSNKFLQTIVFWTFPLQLFADAFEGNEFISPADFWRSIWRSTAWYTIQHGLCYTTIRIGGFIELFTTVLGQSTSRKNSSQNDFWSFKSFLGLIPAPVFVSLTMTCPGD